MSLFSAIGSIGKSVMNVAKGVSSLPILGSVAKAVPFLGTALSVGSIASDLFGGSSASSGGLPALPGAPGGGGSPGSVNGYQMGDRSIFRNDPNIDKAIQAFAVPKAALKVSYRAPRGWVVLHDDVGDPYAIPVKVAKMMGRYHRKAKPPISVKEWHALKRAHSATEKLKKIVKMANSIKGVHVAPPSHQIGHKKGHK